MREIIFIFFTFFILKPNFKFESFIGKSIENISFDGEIFTNDNKRYNFISESTNSFYGLEYDKFSVNIGVENSIETITIRFQRILDGVFFNSFIEQYGKPDIVNVFDEQLSENNISEKNGKKVSKRFYTTKQGRLEDSPFHIQWNKEDFQIKIIQQHENNTTQITFRKPRNDF